VSNFVVRRLLHAVSAMVLLIAVVGSWDLLNGATWLCVGYALASWFPPMAPAGGILVAALADPAAALAGGLAGPSRGKTAHGSVAALMVSLVALWLVGFSWPATLCGAVVGAVLERWPGPLDDNVLIAPGVACVVWLTA
jgi:dolichol kinase